MLLHFDDERGLARRIAGAAGLASATIARHRFPDGEIKLTLPARVPRRIVVLRSLHQPNEKLLELLLAVQTARELGARDVTLVAPYLAYMRQDCAFAPGETVSQRHVGTLLAALFDRLITVDPASASRGGTGGRHARRRRRRGFGGAADRPLPARHMRPPRCSSAPTRSRPNGWNRRQPWAIASGRCAARSGAATGRSAFTCLAVTFSGRRVVLIDDVASTGQTLAETARAVLAAGAARVDVAVTHALFAGDAAATLAAAGVRSVWSTDTIAHPSNAIGVAALVARALGRRRRQRAAVIAMAR